jgi:sugar O-acyltransferase (sialic acid O-acetyltransferase NeuD family)
MKNKANIHLIGSGHHARVVLDCIERLFLHEKTNIYDEMETNIGKNIWDQYVVKNAKDLINDARLHIGIGANNVREIIAFKYCQDLESLYTIIHPHADVSHRAYICKGSFLASGCVVGTDSAIGFGCIINHNAVVDHDCVVGDWSHIAPGATLGGSVKIGKGTLVGAGAVILKGVEVGTNVIVGAGAVVTRNIPDNSVVTGVPARKKV